MYRQSDDPRFIKNRAALQRAFIDLTLEKRSARITVKELAARAGVNRMTFYSHYDEVSDVMGEFIDGLAAAITSPQTGSEPLSIREVLERATDAMQDEMEFFRMVAQDLRFGQYRAQFREGFAGIFATGLQKRYGFQGAKLAVTADMLASGVTYAYLDWLAGKYGDLPLDELVTLCEGFVANKAMASGN